MGIGSSAFARRALPTRNAEVVASLEGKRVHFGTGSDCPNYLDPRTGARRRFTTADVVDCIHLVDATPELDFCMSMGIPAELGATNAYRQQYALMADAHDQAPRCRLRR